MATKRKYFRIKLECKDTKELYEQTIHPALPEKGLQPEEIISVERPFLDQQICSDSESDIEVVIYLPKMDYDEQLKKLKEAARHQAKPAKEKVIKRKYMTVAVLTALGYAGKIISDMTGIDYGKVRKIRSAVYKHLGVGSPATLREWMVKRHLL